ncbi:MAG: hypothetical protein ACTSSE_09485 [Candidatus Thorarchaeota archaeon]
MQDVVIDWATWFPIGISLIALVVSIGVFIDSQMKERTRKKENEVEATSKCYTILQEVIDMHPNLDYPVAFVMGVEFYDSINNRADLLIQLSWNCAGLGENIRIGAKLLKSSVKERYAGDDDYLSNEERKKIVEKIATLRDNVYNHLTELQH